MRTSVISPGGLHHNAAMRQPDSGNGPVTDEDAEAALLQRIAACPSDLRDWAEGLGYQALKARIDSGGAIAAQANATLALLLAGAGGLGTLGLQLLQPHPGVVAWGCAAAAAHLAVMAVATVRHCINLVDAPPMFNRPGNLLVPGVTLEQIRMGELANLDQRIRQQTAINKRRAEALNRIRLRALGGGLVAFALAVVAAAWLR